MQHVQMLDCTLRDGGYLVNKQFGSSTIHGIIEGLVNTQIDMVEIGFLQDVGSEEGNTVFHNAKGAARYIPEKKGNSQFVVLADYSRYSIENLEENDGTSFDGVRACFFKNERYDVIDFCKAIKQKGYKLFVQPVDILGYTDKEIIELIENMNQIEPYAFSIVDTFGSMYVDDLNRLFPLIHNNLAPSIRIGFHSHNNMQLSSALSQEFVKISYGKRNVVVDATLCGMGRGAGNTPTELVVQYLVTKWNYSYNIDELLDVIDGYMDNIKAKCTWGYSIPYFIAGSYSAHVNNITYLTKKNSIRSKDIRFLLNRIGTDARKRYDYDLLEKSYIEYLESDIDDMDDIFRLKSELQHKDIVVIAPGRSAEQQQEVINQYIEENHSQVVLVNFVSPYYKPDYLYFSNQRRFRFWSNSEQFAKCKKIVTSNIEVKAEENDVVISFLRLIKCGWNHIDNSMMMLLRLLDLLEVKSIGIAGFDGYDLNVSESHNYVHEEMEISHNHEDFAKLNEEIRKMYIDYIRGRKHDTPITFITKSRFEIDEL